MKRLKEDRCDAVDNESAIGPGKPYCKMPCGLTGDVSVEGVAGAGGTAGYAGVGGRGVVGEGAEVVVVGDGLLMDCGREKMIALREAPAAAEAAATSASVDLDIVQTVLYKMRAGAERYQSTRSPVPDTTSQAKLKGREKERMIVVCLCANRPLG